MNIESRLLVGGLAGWQASMLWSSPGRPGLLLNVGIGIVGAVIGGWLFIVPFGTLTINEGNPSVGGFLAALLGAVVLLALMKLMQGIATASALVSVGLVAHPRMRSYASFAAWWHPHASLSNPGRSRIVICPRL